MTLTYLNKQTKYTNTENHSLIQDSPSSEMFLDYPSYPLAYYTVAREVLGKSSNAIFTLEADLKAYLPRTEVGGQECQG